MRCFFRFALYGTTIALICLATFAIGVCPAFAATLTARFFYDGDGRLSLAGEKNGETFSGAYRFADGRHDRPALDAIEAVFGAPKNNGRLEVDLRLIAFLDYLQDHFNPDACITITSGYRSPAYNRSIRIKGALAAKASLHQYGMAADIIMEKVSSEHIWRHVQKLGFGGAGYYHGKTVHVDVGPARFWDEKTSGVGAGLSDDNKLIGIITDYDIYTAGEPVRMRFIRMTAFPIRVDPRFVLEKESLEGSFHHILDGKPDFAAPVTAGCLRLADMDQMNGILWSLPANLKSGRHRMRVTFCDNPWTDMPKQIVSPVFVLR